MEQQQKLLFRATEVAEILSLGKSKVYELMAAGELPCVVIGTAKRVPADALRAWVAQQAERQNVDDSVGA